MYLFELAGDTEGEMSSKTEVLKAEPNVSLVLLFHCFILCMFLL